MRVNNRIVINYVPGSTVLHKLTGGTKVALYIVLTVFIIMNFDLRLLLPMVALSLAAIISMKPNYKPILFLFGFMFITVCIIGNIMLFIVSPNAGLNNIGHETVIWQGAGRLYLTKEWLWYVLVVTTKRVASFSLTIAFVLATTPSEFASGLNFVGLPYKACYIVSLAYRTIPDIATSFIDIRNSMMMRGVEMSKKASLWRRLKESVLLLVPLIFSTFGKAGNISNAMDLRGFGREKKRTWYSEHELTKADKVLRVFMWVMIAACLSYIVYHRILFPGACNFWVPFLDPEDINLPNPIDTLFFMKWFKKGA